MNNETLQRIAIYSVLGLVLSAVGVYWDNPALWCVLGLFIASSWVERRAAFEIGVAHGIEMMTDMTEDQRAEVIALVKEAQKEPNE
jgi:hypothetical protein